VGREVASGEVLLKRGADINVKISMGGKTVLHVAVLHAMGGETAGTKGNWWS